MVIGLGHKLGVGKDTVGRIIQILTGYKEASNGEIIYYLDNWGDKEWRVSDSTDFTIQKFADPIKDMVCTLLDCTREDLESEEFKNTELGEEWICYSLYSNFKNNFVEGNLFLTEEEAHIKLDQYKNTTFPTATFKDDVEVKERRMTPRLLMELLGTPCGREIIHPNIWVNSLMSKYKPLKLSEYNPSKWIITDVRFPNEAKAIKDRGGILIKVNRPQAEIRDTNPEKALDNYTEWDYEIDNSLDYDYLINKVKEVLIKEKLI